MTATTAILVTGMHRSGTSATAGALGLCGVALGDELLAPGADNPKGYFEHERAVAINERLLAALGSRWDDVRALPAGWQDSDAAREAAVAIRAFVDSEFAGTPLWALKDPRMCRLMPLWLGVLRQCEVQPVALFVARDPAEVAASIQARNGWAPPLSGIAWLRHMVEAEAASRGLPRTAIAYDALLAEPGVALAAAVERLGIVLPRAPDEASLRRFVDTGDRHQRRESLPAPSGPFAGPIAEVHETLVRIAEGEDAWSSIRGAGEAFAREWETVGAGIDAVADMAARFDAETRAARAEKMQVRSELNAQLDWAREAVAKDEALQAEKARLQSELTAQVRWSEQAVADWEAREAVLVRAREECQATIAEQNATLAERDATIAGIHASLSWRLTRPLRGLAAATRKLLNKEPSSR